VPNLSKELAVVIDVIKDRFWRSLRTHLTIKNIRIEEEASIFLPSLIVNTTQMFK
jgi:hypothetical protein